ncbi:MAG: GNAT family N-acetyltransferase [Nocardioidaceae bacterium]|nr:GNAT family N-acetyltransferase [Nocardioidaceae bacterium]
MDIKYVSTDVERLEVRDFLAEHIPGIAQTAVPATAMDSAYAPLVAAIRSEENTIVAAALTCRAQVAAGASMTGIGRQMFGTALDKHSELDLLAVAPQARGAGLGTALVNDLQGELVSNGVRVWFGNVTEDLEVDKLRGFYARLGFTVLGDGQPLPPLLGKQWVPPFAEMPAFFFYKLLPKQ